MDRRSRMLNILLFLPVTIGLRGTNPSGGAMKKIPTALGILALGLLSFPAISFSEQQQVTGQKSVTFPQSDKCTTNTPCRNVMGEITRIEESYWIKTPEGRETHLKVTKDTKMEGLPKIGDSIAA